MQEAVCDSDREAREQGYQVGLSGMVLGEQAIYAVKHHSGPPPQSLAVKDARR